MRRVYNIQARWDSEGGVWVAETESPNALAKKLRILIPELLEPNGALEPGSGAVEFIVRYEYEQSGVAASVS
jgi:hypothetical protein